MFPLKLQFSARPMQPPECVLLQISAGPMLAGEPSSLSILLVDKPFDIMCSRSPLGLALVQAKRCGERLKKILPQEKWADITTLL